MYILRETEGLIFFDKAQFVEMTLRQLWALENPHAFRHALEYTTFSACRYQALASLRAIVGLGAKVNCFRNKEGRETPLHTALHGPVKMEGKESMCVTIPLTLMGSFDMDEFIAAASSRRQDLELLTLLLDLGVPVNAADQHGVTALHIAVQKGSLEAVELLLSRGASVKARTTGRLGGMTPLHVACDSGKAEIASLLLAHGADCSSTDAKGHTPLYLALQEQLRGVALKMLRLGVSAVDAWRSAASEHKVGLTCVANAGRFLFVEGMSMGRATNLGWHEA
mmetsp:Transcript_12493/g.39929  ORF Transcript_12493/g.39929 Transcript_12493/m.39929 type:complete len:281 (+) Transcript_12493:1-843(+)